MSLRRTLGSLLLLVAPSLSAAVDPSLFQDLHWRSLGPFRGGRVVAVAGVPGEARHFYFGSVNGGVWETNDAGRTWQPIFDSQPIGSIGAIAVAPSNHNVIYVGSGEADMRSDIAQGNGVYKSVDAGKTWTHIGLEDSQQIGRVIVHPQNADVVYVAALGHPYGPNAERGVFRSRDGGKTWQKVLGRDADTGAVDVTFEPGNPDVVYAAIWQTRRTPWSVYPPSNGPKSGLYKSTDGGDHWSEIRGHGLAGNPGRIGLAVAPSMPNRVYAIIDAPEGGMYRSDDGGANWTRTSDDSRIWGRGWYFGGVTVEPKNPDIVYVCNINLMRSIDGGKTWTIAKGAPGGDDYHQLWIDPENPDRRILGVDQGTVVSVNGGVTWSSWYNQPTGQFYHVITDNRFPYWVYGAQQDSGAAGIPSRTNTVDALSLPEFHEMSAGGESDNVAPDPKDPDIIFGGRVDRLNVKTRQSQSVDPTIDYPDTYRRTWTLPLVFSYRDPRVLYFSNQRVFRTDDGGEHWTVISPDLTREDPGVPPNLDPATAAIVPTESPRRGVVYAIAPSRVADHDIWVGTDDGLIWRTRDEGAHWTNVTPAALTGWSKVGIIDTSHFDAETAYAAIDRHRLEDFRPYIYRTRDGGKSWQLITNGIPANYFVNVVREDPVRKGLLYAGTERGMYVSFDDGANWQSLQMNLPVTSVRDIDVHGNDVVIATHGRSFWAIDDVSPLRQADVVGQSNYLYQPATAIRFRPAGFTGTPMPKDEPMAPNPPNGATIDYVLKTTPAQPVTLEIFDGSNNLVRRYSSADQVPSPNPATLRTAAEWFAVPSSIVATPGMHRFVWPMRYAAPAALAGSRGVFADGVWAPPGKYTVTLTVDGEKLTRSLNVLPDPRAKMTDAQYREQFELTRAALDVQARLAVALEEAEKVVAKLDELQHNANGSIAAQLEETQKRAAVVTDVWPGSSTAWWLAPKQNTSLRFADSLIDKVVSAADYTDTPISPDVRSGFAKAKPIAENALAAWEAFKAKELAELNEKLKASGAAPIEVK